MNQIDKDRLLEFLELTGLSKSLSSMVKQAEQEGLREEAVLGRAKQMILNYQPSESEQDDLMQIFGSDFGIDWGGKIQDAEKNEILEKDYLSVKTPSDLPDPSSILAIKEPFLNMDIIAPTEYTGKIIELINDSRGECTAINSLSLGQIQITASIPLAEVIVDFYDQLKSGTKGYASMSYEISGYRASDLVKIDILLNGKIVEPLSVIVHKQNSEALGRRVCEKLKELIPRQQVEIAIQASIGSRVIARETIKPFRKDVTAKLYGGDITRRMKLLDKQKEGKKRMKSFANVNIPNDVFLNMLKG